MNKIILVVIVAIIVALVIFGKELMTKTEHTNWFNLVEGQNSEYSNLRFQFSSIEFNGKILQHDLNCLSCPIELKIDKDDSFFKIRSKQLFRQYDVDTLVLLFNYKYWIQQKILVQPKFTYIIHSECDTISKLVYSEVFEVLNKPLSKNINLDSLNIQGEIDLNNVFKQLINGHFKKWMAAEKAKTPTDINNRINVKCVQYLKALEYLSDGDQSGFKSSKYNLQDTSLNKDQKIVSYLTSICSVVQDLVQQFNGKKGDLKLIITGYADTVNIIKPILITKESANDRIFYDAEKCVGNDSIGLEPIDFKNNNSFRYTELIDYISAGSNCELSAIRAYYATKFIQQKLGDKIGGTKIHYYYCAGGVSHGADLDNHRKINVLMKFTSVSKQN